ncbi:MAG: integral rane sensor signal transduction histidine kinase [Acidimicrobiaceae bacterium]|jgi:signal transduction histidine kinase|nr:integral rane sensor signal transduction histidine kinase [Acidimicrobiaceae bacterium]
MRLPRLPLHTLRGHLPARTVRSRLTFVYGALFLVSGAVLLVITGVLWGRATTGPVTISARVPGRILQIASPPIHAPPAALERLPSGSAVKQLRKIGQQLQLVAKHQQSSDLHQLLLYSAIALGIMALIAIVLGWLTAGRVLRPLRTITSTAKEISASNLHERLDMKGPDDELKRLGDTFDELLGRLERSFEAQRLFVANASHELRTPLATMRASIDVALAKPDPIPPAMQRLAEGLEQELDHIDLLLEGFLALARAERGPADEDVAVSLDALATTALGRRTGPIAALGLAVGAEECPAAVVRGSETLLARMIENVIDNAVHHNVAGGYLRVRTAVEGETARLVVENGGAVLDEQDVGALVQPFRRVGTARTGSENGFGLGLSIVAAIAETHGGRVELVALDSGGVRVMLELPLAVRTSAGVSA